MKLHVATISGFHNLKYGTNVPGPLGSCVTPSKVTIIFRLSRLRFDMWLDAPASSQARVFTVPGVAACTASDLSVSVHVANSSYVGAGPKDVTSWEIDVSDTGPTPCFVGSSLDVSLYVDSEPLAIAKGAPYNGDIVYLTAGSAAAQSPF